MKETNLEKTNAQKILYILLSFLIPAGIILAALASLKVAPFGGKTLAISDGNALYLNYLGYVARAVKGQENLFFSFEKGLGGNMMSSWGWFLLNPFFPLFAFFDITNYMTAFTWVSLLNFSLCGLTMYILLKDIYGYKLSNLIFSTSYALNGFLVANVFQLNFFTGVPTLPLVVLGLRKIFKDKNPLLYILALAYGLMSNFYFGFMLCAASLLIFLTVFFADREEIVNPKAVAVKYVLSSLLAGALSAVVWLPAVLALRGGRLDQEVRDMFSLRENMPFLSMFSKLFTGANNTNELVNGLPNIFVGILPVALAILFFMNKKIRRQKKTVAGILLGVYLVSFYLALFNILMHGGTVTNWFNYRDSFVFCFLLLLIAAEEWQYVAEEPDSHIKRAAVILILAVLIVFSKTYEFVRGGAVALDLALLALMFLAVYMHRHRPEKLPKKLVALIVLALVSVNLFLNYRISTKNIMEWSITRLEYQAPVIPVSTLLDAAHMNDKSFARMEVNEQRSATCGNDSMLYGYYGVGHGGSDDRNFVRDALSMLGIHRFDMRNYYGEGVPGATDSLLGLKYVIARDDLTEEKGYPKLVELEKWALYQNPYVLNIAMLAGEGIDDVELGYTDVFENLNNTWAAISGKDIPIFIEENDISFVSHNASDPQELTHEDASAIVEKRDAKLEKQKAKAGGESENASVSESESAVESESASDSENSLASLVGAYMEPPENSSYIMYTWTAKQDGPVYSYNRFAMVDGAGGRIPAMIYSGYYHKGDTVTGYIPVSENSINSYMLEEVAGRFRAAYVDMDALSALSRSVNNRDCTIKRISDEHLSGRFTTAGGQRLLFTIPYDEGWTCRVDGEIVPIKKTLGAFMAVDAEPGMHTYTMDFVPSGLVMGATFSAAALAGTAVLLLADHKRKGRPAPSADTDAAPETENDTAAE